MKFITKIFAGLLSVVMVSSLSEVKATTTTCDIYEGDNIETQNYSRWSSVIDSYLTVGDDGKLMRVQNTLNDGIIVEYYDNEYNIIENKNINAELPIFGGFYATSNNYYIVTGQTNETESASVEVIRVTKYDKQWNRLGHASLYDCNTVVPFHAGSCRFDICGKYLIIRTSHKMYTATDGLNHQANATLQIDTDTMTVTDSYFDVMNISYGYVSHSFNQFIKMDGNNIIALDHGDAYPRSIVLIKYGTDASTGKFSGRSCTAIDILNIPGKIGDNSTNATIGGLEVSSSSYIAVGNSVIQDENNLNRTTKNVYVASVNKSNNSVNINWLTNYVEGDGTTSTPQLVKIAKDSYAVLWSRDNKVYYQLINGTGVTTSEIYSIEGELSDCVPVVTNNKIVWYTWEDNINTFYEISIDDLSNTKKIKIENGHKYVSNGVTNGIANLYCSKCGGTSKVTVPTDCKVWWNEPSKYTYYTTAYEGFYDVGDKLICNISVESGKSDKFEFLVQDSSIVSVKVLDDNRAEFTMLKKGITTIIVRSKWNPDLICKYSVNVGNVTVETTSKEGTTTKNGGVQSQTSNNSVGSNNNTALQNESNTKVNISTKKVAKAKIKSIKKIKGKKAKIVIVKIKKATGYQIKYSTSKKFIKKYTNSKTSKSSIITLKNLKKGKTYYVKARGYRIDGKKKYYGKYSKVMKIKINK